MIIITRERVKELLGIVVTDYDTQIDLNIPIVDSLTRQIIGGDFETLVNAETTLASDQFVVSHIAEVAVRNEAPWSPKNGRSRRGDKAGLRQPYILDETASYFDIGQRLEGDGIASDSYITNVSKYNNTLTMNNNADAGGYGYVEIGFPIGLEPMVAKMVYWQLSQMNTNTPKGGVQSKTIGPVTTAFGDANSQLDGRYGAPSWYVKALSPLKKTRAY